MQPDHKGKAGPLLGLALLLCACSPSAQDQASEAADNAGDDVATANFVNRMAGVEKPPPPAKPFQQAQKTDLLEFLYAWPAQAAAVPAIDAKFRKDLETGKADALKMAAEDRKSARQAGFPFHAHSLETRWSVVADTPRFLSLESSRYTYTGGAHGMTGYGALLWDKARKRETSIRAVMTSPDAFAAAIHDRFCDGLDKARAKKRGGPIMRGDDPFTQCIDPMKEVLVPVSSDGKLIDAIKVVIAPYSAGPYAEGNYEVRLPVDAAMRKAIKTEYQDAFVGAP
jgi:hypothetical protein